MTYNQLEKWVSVRNYLYLIGLYTCFWGAVLTYGLWWQHSLGGGPGLCSNGEKELSTSKDTGQHVYINLSLLLTVDTVGLAAWKFLPRLPYNDGTVCWNNSSFPLICFLLDILSQQQKRTNSDIYSYFIQTGHLCLFLTNRTSTFISVKLTIFRGLIYTWKKSWLRSISCLLNNCSKPEC